MNKFIVGDLHGSYDKLMKALDLAKFSDDDILYCTGDICDRGPKIYETLDFVVSLGDRFKSVFGNHDVWMYHYLKGDILYDANNCWRYNGGDKTQAAIYQHTNRFEEFEKFYAKMPYIIEEDTFRIIHTPTFNNVLDRSNIDIHNVNLSNLSISGLLCDEVYDDILFSRDIIYNTLYFNNSISIEDYGDSIDFGSDKKLTIVGHTPLNKGILYDKEYNLIDIDTAGFCYKERYGFDGCISIMNLKTFDIFDSNGLTYNLK